MVIKRYPKTLSVLVSEAAQGLSVKQRTFSAADVIRWLQEHYPGVEFHNGAVRCHIIQHTVNAHPSHDDYPDHGRRWKEQPVFVRQARGVYRAFDSKKDQAAYDAEVRQDQPGSARRERGAPRAARSFQNLRHTGDLVTELSLQQREAEAIDRTLAFMAYNPSIGRVLEEGGVGKFQDFAVETLIPLLSSSCDHESFDRLLLASIDALRKKVKTHRERKPSFGQAQKPINVFLKVYCDWAGRPSSTCAKLLRSWLHVPLDSVVMNWLRKNLRADFEARIAPIYRQQGEMASKLDLLHMNRKMYIAWQQWFRAIYPERPVLLDVIWAVERGGKEL